MDHFHVAMAKILSFLFCEVNNNFILLTTPSINGLQTRTLILHRLTRMRMLLFILLICCLTSMSLQGKN